MARRPIHIVVTDETTGKTLEKRWPRWRYRLERYLVRLSPVLAILGVLALGISAFFWTQYLQIRHQRDILLRDVEKAMALKQEILKLRKAREQLLQLLEMPMDTAPEEMINVTPAAGVTELGLDRRIPQEWPARGILSRRFSRYHPGIDISAPEGTPVVAPGDGIVREVGETPRYGIYVVIQHTQDLETLYGHLQKALVIQGWRVQKGDLIGFVGNTGRSKGPHLHYEVRRKGIPVDPLSYLPHNSEK